MKTLKTLLSVFAIAAVFSAGAYAQVSDDVAVTAEVQSTLTIATTDVALGGILAATSILDANSSDDATETNVGTGASAGTVTIGGTGGVNVTVSWNNATLNNVGETNPITFTPSVWTQAGSELTTPGGSTVAIGAGSPGSVVLDVGGELDAPSGTGSYSTGNNGTPITFTVQYQ